MKKIHSFLMAAVLVAGSLTSCSSSDDQESKTAQSQQEIKFSANAELTRGSVYTGTAGPDAMKVYAFKNSTNYIDGAIFNVNSGTYTCTTKYYWPTGTADTDKLTFLALYPTNAPLTYSDHSNQAFSYTASTTIDDQVDLMAAKSNALLLSETTAGKVALTFGHLLTQIVFKGYVEENANLKVTVSGIEIHNVKKTGSTTTTDGTVLTASAEESNKDTYAITLTPTELAQGSASPTDLTTTASNALMLIPQTGTAWTTTPSTAVTIAANDGGDKNAYLKVSVKIQNKTNDDYILGTAETPQAIYFPLAPSWTAGKKVTYTLQFGATTGAGNGVGYDEDGAPETLNATGVTFSATVTDWEDEAQTVTF